MTGRPPDARPRPTLDPCDAEPPIRYLELLGIAERLGQRPAASLAALEPGMKGLLLFCAARGDTLRSMCQMLGLSYGEVAAILEPIEE